MHTKIVIPVLVITTFMVLTSAFGMMEKGVQDFNFANETNKPSWLNIYRKDWTYSNHELIVNGMSGGMLGLANPEVNIPYWDEHGDTPVFVYLNLSNYNYGNISRIDMYLNYTINIHPILPYIVDGNKTYIDKYVWQVPVTMGFEEVGKNSKGAVDYIAIWQLGMDTINKPYGYEAGYKYNWVNYWTHGAWANQYLYVSYPSIKNTSIPQSNLSKGEAISTGSVDWSNYFIKIGESVHLTYIDINETTAIFLVNSTNRYVGLYETENNAVKRLNYAIKTDMGNNKYKVVPLSGGKPLIEINACVITASNYPQNQDTSPPQFKDYGNAGQFRLSGFHVKIDGYFEEKQKPSNNNTDNNTGNNTQNTNNTNNNTIINSLAHPRTVSYLLTGIIGVGMVVGDAYIFRKYP